MITGVIQYGLCACVLAATLKGVVVNAITISHRAMTALACFYRLVLLTFLPSYGQLSEKTSQNDINGTGPAARPVDEFPSALFTDHCSASGSLGKVQQFSVEVPTSNRFSCLDPTYPFRDVKSPSPVAASGLAHSRARGGHLQLSINLSLGPDRLNLHPSKELRRYLAFLIDALPHASTVVCVQ
jgi:hypothetical protein